MIPPDRLGWITATAGASFGITAYANWRCSVR